MLAVIAFAMALMLGPIIGTGVIEALENRKARIEAERLNAAQWEEFRHNLEVAKYWLEHGGDDYLAHKLYANSYYRVNGPWN